jgi:Holliday junction DNA helicase RuvA
MIDKRTREKIVDLGVGSEVSLHIHSVTKEDGTVMYGFLTFPDKMWFLELIKISGVSGRIALSIIAYVGTENMSTTLSIKDEKAFVGATGVGAKLSSRVMNELKDISSVILHTCEIAVPKLSSAFYGTNSSNVENGAININANSKNKVLDAIEALVSLGIPRNTAQRSVTNAWQSDNNLSIEDIIKTALMNSGQ